LETKKAYKSRVNTARGWRVRIFLAVSLVLLIWGAVYVRLVGLYRDSRDAALHSEIAALTTSYGSALGSALNQRLSLIQGVSAYITVKVTETHGGYDPSKDAEFQQFASVLYGSAEGMRNIAISPDFVVRAVYPADPGNRRVIGNNILEDKRVGFAASVRRAIETRRIAVHEPVELIQGGMGILARQAVFEGDRPWGAVGIAFLAEPIIQATGLSRLDGLNWGLRTGQGTAVVGNMDVFGADPVLARINLPDGYWEIGLAPDQGWDKAINSGPIYDLLQAGLLLCGLFLLLAVVSVMTKRRQLQTEVAIRTRALLRAQTELKEQSQRLRQANEELERFAYVVAHDLQEPLRSITSFSQLILRGYEQRLDEEGRSWLALVISGGQRMRQLLRDVQLFLAEASLPLPAEPQSVDSALEEAKQRLTTIIEASGAIIDVANLPMVMADQRRMTEIFCVLLANALEYRSPERPPHIRVGSYIEGRYQAIEVEDNGVGIPPEYHQRIFEVFQRLHGRNEHPGTGMGLAIARKMVQRLGGGITLRSTPGKGSTFVVKFPKVPT